MVVCIFEKCGISLSLDSSENGEIHIESIKEYELPTANEITEFNLIAKAKLKMTKVILLNHKIHFQKMNLVIK